MTKIKICGITNLTDALLASDFGADAIGFIFAPSPRRISPLKASRIISNLPPFIHKVGVFKDENICLVKKIMNDCSLDFVQFHGKEDRTYLKEFGQRGIKVFEINRKNFLTDIKKFPLHFFMLDLPKGGENKMNLDWHRAKKAKQLGKVILACGLTPENIETVLRIVAPFGVDVCRGVEQAKGKKDPEKMEEFIRKVRKWDILRA